MKDLSQKVTGIRDDIKTNLSNGRHVTYQAPWTSPDAIATNSLDLLFSQAVLEHVDDLKQTYEAMFTWLKSGGYASHVIDFGSHHLAPFWNGHLAYSDLEWKIVRGRREFLLNREPLSTHLDWMKNVGFDLLSLHCTQGNGGLTREALPRRYSQSDDRDIGTKGAIVILRKP
jgi:hypothetical protein